MITAIQTRYAGCHFRSRLEARWAVLFDNLGIEWEYEPQGYLVGPGRRAYLPDFYFPATKTWVEVKPTLDAIDYGLMMDCVDWGRGLPGLEGSAGTDRGLMILGPIPRITPMPLPFTPWHPVLQHHKGVIVSAGCLTPDGAVVLGAPEGGRLGFDSCDPSNPGFRAEISKLFAGKGGATSNWESVDAYIKARSARFEHRKAGAK